MRWVKFLVGLALAPAAVGTAWALGDIVVAWLPGQPWKADWFWALVAGALGFLVMYFMMTKPLWLYVLGHELTHAVCVWLAGGRIYGIHVSSEGGHVATSKVTWWIALSPYFVPFYTVLGMGGWWVASQWIDLREYEVFLFFGIGFTYAFHVAFTLFMLHPDQSDLAGEGFVFSGVVIFLLNCVVLGVMLIAVSPEVTWAAGGTFWLQRVASTYDSIGFFVGQWAGR
jgi:hypothetical protein